jgi:RNA polymerase sigma-70 factor, ECF subfamily
MDGSGDLIARARRGDEDAFRLIFERWSRPVAGFILCMVNRRDAAEELAQETFVRAYRQLGSLRDESKLSTWLFGIARRVALEHLRARRRESSPPESAGGGGGARTGGGARFEDAGSPAGLLLDKELGRKVSDALAALDEDKRVVFALKVYQQHSYDEIAEITGFSPAKVRNDLHRARAEMRRRLAPYVGVRK